MDISTLEDCRTKVQQAAFSLIPGRNYEKVTDPKLIPEIAGPVYTRESNEGWHIWRFTEKTRIWFPYEATKLNFDYRLIPICSSGSASIDGRPVSNGVITSVAQNVDITPELYCIVIWKGPAKTL